MSTERMSLVIQVSESQISAGAGVADGQYGVVRLNFDQTVPALVEIQEGEQLPMQMTTPCSVEFLASGKDAVLELSNALSFAAKELKRAYTHMSKGGIVLPTEREFLVLESETELAAARKRKAS